MTKTLDSTVSQLLQDNSAVEYVAPEKNPICKKQSDNSLFNFHAEHNGEACIESLRPEDRGTERQFWFTVAMFVDTFDEQRRTIERNIESLIEDQEVSDKNVQYASILDINGIPHKATIYNLEVLNKLGMCCFRGNKKAKEIRNKFNDVLVKHETQNQPVMLPNFCNPAEAARAWADLYEKNQAIEHRALTAESERDEAIRTKAMIGSRREATAMATASAKSRECEKLREQIGDSKTYKAVTAISWLPDYFNISDRGVYIALAHKLKKLEAEMPREFAHTDIPDSRYGTVKAYHVDVIERLHEMVQADENLMSKYRKIASV